MRWCYFGCSHSSSAWGKTWAHYLGEYLGAPPLLDGSGQGASNEFALIKLLTSIEEHNPDLIVWQLTEYSRLTLGIDGYIPGPKQVFKWNDPFIFDKAYYYTFNVVTNLINLENHLKQNFSELDNFFIKHCITSTYNQQIKPFQTILTAQAACKLRGIKILFFRWWEQPIVENKVNIAISKQIDWEDVMPEYVWQWCEQTKGRAWIKAHDKLGDYHLDSEAHETIAKELIIPFVKRRLDANQYQGLAV